MSLEVWALFVVTETVLCLTPGPAVLLVLSQGLARGVGASVWQVLVLGVTSVVIEFFVLLAYGAAAGRASALAGRPRFRTLANRLAGSMLIVAGVGIARIRHA